MVIATRRLGVLHNGPPSRVAKACLEFMDVVSRGTFWLSFFSGFMWRILPGVCLGPLVDPFKAILPQTRGDRLIRAESGLEHVSPLAHVRFQLRRQTGCGYSAGDGGQDPGGKLPQ